MKYAFCHSSLLSLCLSLPPVQPCHHAAKGYLVSMCLTQEHNLSQHSPTPPMPIVIPMPTSPSLQHFIHLSRIVYTPLTQPFSTLANAPYAYSYPYAHLSISPPFHPSLPNCVYPLTQISTLVIAPIPLLFPIPHLSTTSRHHRTQTSKPRHD